MNVGSGKTTPDDNSTFYTLNSKLGKLIQQYCPEGVEFHKIKDVYKRIKGTPITATKMKEIANPAGSVRIFAGGKTVIDANEEDIPNANITRVPAVLVQSRGVIDVVYCEQPFTFKNEMWAYTTENKTSVKYLYYVMKSNVQTFRDAASGMGALPQISLVTTEDFEIPLPPLPVQEEIVSILDTFTNLQTELQAELQARQEQYLYYQDLLLNKSQYSKHITIGELCVVKKGNTPIQKAKDGKYPLVATTMERRSCDTFQFNTNAVCIPLVSSRGHGVASLNHIYYQEGMFALGNILCAVIPNDERVVKAKYLYYYLEYAKDYTLVPLMKGGANVSLHCSDIEKVKIPLPSLSEQERIISILDSFDTLVNDLFQGLPAEIEARRQQHEYYRDQLLTFKRKEV